jgi:hypothetical protein
LFQTGTVVLELMPECYGFSEAAGSMEEVVCCDAEFQGYRFFIWTIRFRAVLFADLRLRGGLGAFGGGRERVLAAAA